MQNLKIRVNSADESKEAQELFFDLGGSWAGYKKIHDWPEIKQLYLSENYITFSNDINFFAKDSNKEITLLELRAMVNPMNEYLEPLPNREYKYHSNVSLVGGEWIKIPEGAESFGYTGIVHTFYKNDFRSFFNENTDGQWDERSETCFGMKDPVILWQRDQDEPFLTPETTLNDQYAEIEEVRQVEIHGTVKAKPDFNFGAAQAIGGVDATLAERQTQYGCYEDVAQVTQQILSALRIGNYDKLPAPMKESLHMIASKMARIVNGDPEYFDNWHDIGGYAKLIEKLIRGE